MCGKSLDHEQTAQSASPLLGDDLGYYSTQKILLQLVYLIERTGYFRFEIHKVPGKDQTKRENL